MAIDTTALQQQLQADPDYRDTMTAIQQMNASGGVWQNSPAFAKLMALNKKYAGQLPQGYGIGFDGQLHQDSFMNRHAGALSALSMVPAGLGIGSALAGGGAAAASGTGSIATGTSAADAAAAGVLPSTGSIGVSALPAGGAGLGGAAGVGGGILGALGKYGGVLGDLGNVLTNASSADRNASLATAGQNARAIAENNAAKVNAAKYNLELPSVRASQVARGGALANMQDAPLTGDPRIDKFSGGGLKPSVLGPQAKQAGALESSTALNALQNPSTDRLTPQEIPPFSGSMLDNIGAGAGLGLDIFSLLSKYGRNPNGTNPNPSGLPNLGGS